MRVRKENGVFFALFCIALLGFTSGVDDRLTGDNSAGQFVQSCAVACSSSMDLGCFCVRMNMKEIWPPVFFFLSNGLCFAGVQDCFVEKATAAGVSWATSGIACPV